MSIADNFTSIDELVDKEDWAIIISKEGYLKGIYIPEGSDEDDFVPESILTIMKEYFGVDMTDSVTLH